jgi:hypothetical protein
MCKKIIFTILCMTQFLLLMSCLNTPANINASNIEFQSQTGISLTFALRGLYSVGNEFSDNNIILLQEAIANDKIDFVYDKPYSCIIT